MTIVWILVALALAFAVAAVVVGREARRLDAEPPRPVFDPDEAVEWVANHLPFEVSAVLSHDDVRSILEWNLEYFRSKGVSGNGSTPHVEAPIVVGGAETVAYVLDRANRSGRDYQADQVLAVLDAQMSYLEAIGAVGPEAGEQL
ncbi:MAG TPA: hypothetical protein VM933_06415 [Acidimicrobiales bacterium]|nr:hypothetical protein [Acidimicrobiales bacterium]